jgi:hypothetical protein
MARAFTDVLREMAGGATLDDLTEQMAELVTAVLATQKSGTLNLKIKVSPNGLTSVRLSPDIKKTVPEPSRGESVFFVKDGHDLVRNDPRQPDLPLRAVPDVRAPETVKVV